MFECTLVQVSGKVMQYDSLKFTNQQLMDTILEKYEDQPKIYGYEAFPNEK